MLNDVDDPRGIGYEEDRAEHGALRDTGSDCHCLGGIHFRFQYVGVGNELTVEQVFSGRKEGLFGMQ